MPIFWKRFPRMRCLSRPTLGLETVSSQKLEYLGLKYDQNPQKNLRPCIALVGSTRLSEADRDTIVPVGGTVA
jgi:hypothetical protein